LHPDDVKWSDEEVQMALKGEKDFDIVFRVIWPDGTVRHIEAHGDVYRGTNGEPVRMIGVNFDITEHIKNQEEIEKSKNLLSTVQQIGVIGSWEYDIINNTPYWSDEIYRIFGLKPQEIEPTYEGYIGYMHPEDREMALKTYNESLMNKNPSEIDHRLKLKDGSIKYVHQRWENYYDSDGKPIRSIGMIQDITNRKKTEGKLRERVKELDCFYAISSLVETNDLLEDIYSGTVNILANAYQYPEYTRARIIIEDSTYTSDGFIDSHYKQSSDIVVFGERKGVIEVFYIEEKADSDEGPFLIEERRLINAVAERLGRITERKKTAEELKKLKQDFASMIAHDLRSPITSIKGFTDMMASGMLGSISDKQGEALSIIKDAIGRQLSLVNDYLDLSKMESGNINIDTQKIDISQTIDSSISLIKIQAESKNINLSSIIDDHLPSVLGDTAKLEQVLINLLTNAVKFTPNDGSIVVAAAKAQDDDYIQISVSDTGEGISEDELAIVFDKYKQTKTGKKSERKSTGLGLAISKLIIEAHGGNIWVESMVGKGSTFYFTVPIAQ
jgi:PAS domain S-box-containing protein